MIQLYCILNILFCYHSEWIFYKKVNYFILVIFNPVALMTFLINSSLQTRASLSSVILICNYTSILRKIFKVAFQAKQGTNWIMVRQIVKVHLHTFTSLRYISAQFQNLAINHTTTPPHKKGNKINKQNLSVLFNSQTRHLR